MKKFYLAFVALLLITVNNIHAQVTVNATAGTLTAPYTTLGAAFTAINNGVHQGVISIDISGGTTETATAILNNGIVIPASYTSVSIQPTASATITGNIAGALIKLNGADNVTINGLVAANQLTFSNTSNTTASAVFWVASASATDPSTDNSITNCIITGQARTTTHAGIVQSSGTTLTSAAEAANSNNTYSNNTITSCFYGIRLLGPGTGELNNIVNTNTINTLGYRGVSASNQASLTISGNTITDIDANQSGNTNPPAGVIVTGSVTNSSIRNNNISDVLNANTGGWSVHGITLQSSDAISNIEVYNNFISNIYGDGWDGAVTDNGHGIGVIDGGGYSISFNSVNLVTNSISRPGTSAGIIITSASDGNLSIRNNIFSNQRTTGTRYAIISQEANTAFTVIDFNNYYSNQSVGFLTTAQATLANWQTATGQDASSVDLNPFFTSATNLHLLGNSPMDGIATPIAGITTDIDGNARNATTPDIGADEFTPPNCSGAANGGTATASTTNICNSGSATLSATGYSFGTGSIYQWEIASAIGGPYTPIAGQTTPYTGNTGVINATRYFRLRAQCNAGAPAYSNIITITVNNPVVSTSTGATRCGYGTVNLAATAAGGLELNWYNSLAATVPAGTGTSYTTPAISTTTNFYVGASTVITSNVGPVVTMPYAGPCGALTSTTLTDEPLRFVTTGSTTIIQTDIVPVSAGTFVVALRQSGTTVNIDTRTFTILAGEVNTVKTIVLNFFIPTAGSYQLTNVSGGIHRFLSFACSYPFVSAGGTFSIVGSASFSTAGTVTNVYRSFFNLLVKENCEGTRTAVVATVTAPPAFTTFSATPNSICIGDDVSLDVASANAGYTYEWMPGNLTGANQAVAPTTTGWYVVTATDASGGANDGCIRKDSLLVTVNPTPADVVLNFSNLGGCTSSILPDDSPVLPLTYTGGNDPNRKFINEHFNSAVPPAGWTFINNSTLGTPADAAWTQRQNNYLYGSNTFVTNDGTPFMLSNSDDQGFGSTTETIMMYDNGGAGFDTRGVLSGNIILWHHYQHLSGDAARVEYSVSGVAGPWVAVQTYTSSQGTRTSFSNAVIPMPAGMLNQPNVMLRFKYDATFGWWWAINSVEVSGNWSPVTYAVTSSPGGSTPQLFGSIGPNVAYNPLTYDNTVFFTGNLPGVYVITATSNFGGVCTKTATTTITLVASGVSATIVSDDADNIICAGQQVTFTATGVNGGTNEFYTWYVNGTPVASGSFLNTYTTNTLVGTPSIYVTLASNSTCAGVPNPATSNTINMTVEANPTANITSSLPTVCEGGPTATLTANITGAVTAYQWYLSGTAIGGATANTYVTNVAGNYSVVVSTLAGCKDSVSFVLNPTASYSITASAGANGTINPAGAATVNCGSTQAYVITANPGYQILSIVVNGTPLVGPFASPYTYTFTNVNANQTITATFNIPGCASSATSNAGPDASLCSGSLFTLPGAPTATIGGSATTGTWSSTGTGSFSSTAYVVGGGNTYNPSAADIAAGSVTIRLTTNDPDGGGACLASQSSFVLTINPTPSLSIAGNLGYCTAASTTLTATASIPAGTYGLQWYNGAVPIAGATSASLTFNAGTNPAGNYSLVATGTPGGCTATETFTITAAANPTALIAGSNVYCTGTTADLNAIGAAGSGFISGYQWNLTGIPIGGATGVLYSTNTAGTYTVTVTNSFGCATTSANFALGPDTSPLNGTYSIGLGAASCTNYISFESAFADLNTRGLDGNVLFEVPGDYSETAPLGGLRLGSALLNSNLATPYTLTFIKLAGGGANPVIYAQVGSGTTADGIVYLTGVDNTTFDQIDLKDNNAGGTAMMEWGYGFFRMSATDGAQNNTIQNCVIDLNRNNNTTLVAEGSVGILSLNLTAAFAANTPTAATGAFSNNKFYANTIQNVNHGVYISGFASATLGDAGNDIGGSSALTGNIITNIGGGGANGAGAVRMTNQYGFTVSYNSISNLVGTAHTGPLRGIWADGTANNTNVSITNNTINLVCNSTLVSAGILNAVGGSGTTNTVVISNNVVKVVNTNAAGGAMDGIANTGTAFTTILNANRVYENALRGNTAYRGIFTQPVPGSGNATVNNNVLENCTIESTSTTFFAIASGATGNVTLSNNRISNVVTYTAATTVHWLNSGTSTNIVANNNIVENNINRGNLGASTTVNWIGGSTSTTANLTATGNQVINNRINNITGAFIVTMNGISSTSSSLGNATVSNNIVRRLSVGGTSTGLQSITGIRMAGNSTATINISSNEVDSLYSNANLSAEVNGIYSVPGAAGASTRVFNNQIRSLFPGQSATAGAVGRGIFINLGVARVYNNFINLDLTQTFVPAVGWGTLAGNVLTADNALRGVETAAGSDSLSFNTIRINGAAAGNFGSSAVMITGGTTRMNNNIAVNLSTASGTGIVAAIRKVLAAIHDATSDRNNLYAGATLAAPYYIFYDGTNNFTDLPTYKASAAMGTRDDNAVSINPVFVSTTDLHIDIAAPINPALDGTALPNTYVTNDIDLDIRDASVPDIGADEFTSTAPPVYYRSFITGNWNNAATWETSPTGLAPWAAATLPPTAASLTITIRNTHTVTINTTSTMDEVVIENGGTLLLATNGRMTVANGTGDDITINNGGIFQVTSTDSYVTSMTFAASAVFNINTGGKITIGNAGAVGSGYDALATSLTPAHIWNTGAIYEWNSTGAFAASGITYFQNAAAGTTPIFRITTVTGTPGGGSNTLINGLTQVNANFTWTGAGNKTFRDGICGSAIMTCPVAMGTFDLGIAPPTGTASIILGGSNLRIVTDKQINIADNITVTVPIDSFVTISSTNASNISKGANSNFVVNGSADMTTVSISNASGAVSINGTLRTAHIGGLENTGAGGTVSTATSVTNVNHGSTIEYYATVNQAITGSLVLEPDGAGGDTYHHIKFSGSATKTPGNAVAVHDSVTITGTPVVNFMANNLGSTVSEKFIMDGGRLRLGTTGPLPLMDGQYVLTGGVVEFASDNVVSQNIRGTATNAYYNVEVAGNNVSQSSGNVNINSGGSFTIKDTGVLYFTDAAITGPTGAQTFIMETGAVFNVANVWGFNGPPEAMFPFRTPALHANFETITLNSNSTINYNRNAPLALPHDQIVTNTVPYQNIIFSGLGIKSPASGATLEIKGNITKAGTTASFGHNEGTVLLTGTALQTYIATSAPIIEFNNLTTNNTVGLNVKSDMGINQKMLFGSAAIISLRDTSDVIIRSRADTTGWIAAIPVNVTINYQANVDSGRFVVERYNYAAKKWRFYSIPTIQTQTVKAAWQEGAIGSGQNPVPGYGTQIGSLYSNWAARNFDFLTPGGHDMKYWSEDASQKYIPLGRTDTIISTDRGYMKYVRGDRSVIGGAATASVLRTRGQIKRNAVTVPFTATAANQRFSAGNPYASAVDMRNITRTNASAMFYVWDPRLNNGVNGGVYGLGAFQLFTFDGTNYRVFPGTGSYGAANSVDNNIESGSAFFVQSSGAGAGSVAFNESSKTDGSRPVFRGGAGTAERFMSILEAMTPTGEATMDGIMLDFAADNSNEINGEDGIKMANSGENISILKAGQELMFERHGTIVAADTVFVKMTNMRQQPYRFKLLVENMAKPGLSAWLIDKYLDASTPVDLVAGGYYNFEVNSAAGSSASDRFMIVFKQATVVPVKIVSIDAERNADETITVNWKVENETNIARYELERSENGRSFSTIVNNVAAVDNNGGRATYTKLDNQPLANDNFYRIKAVSTNGRVDYSSIVKVSADKQPATITINPNPVINRQMNINFVKQVEGNYQLDLTAANGQLISTNLVAVQGRSMVKQVYLKEDLAAGTYNLRITGPGGLVKVITVFVE